MVRRYVAFVLAATAVAVSVTSAAEKWQSRPFNTWTDVELKEVLTSSPWAGKADVTYVQSGGGPIGQVVLVSWSSALPVRQATERGKFKAGAAVPPDVEARLAAAPDAYVIRVITPLDFATQAALRHQGVVPTDDLALQAALMYPETSLRRAGKPPLRPSQVKAVLLRDDKLVTVQSRPYVRSVFWQRGQPQSDGHAVSVFIFTFPKTDLLTVDDATVQFATKLCTTSLPDLEELAFNGHLSPPCRLNVKKTFILKEMVYHGALAL